MYTCLITIEFSFVLEDLKSQMQQIPHLQSLLKLTQKTTKKLDCLNLYSQLDKREFDLELEEQSIYTEIQQLYKAITSISEDCPATNGQIEVIQSRISQIKDKYMITFDMLTKQQQILGKQLDNVSKMLENDEKKDEINQIKQMDEYEDDFNDGNYQFNIADGYNTQNIIQSPESRIDKLKAEIDQVQKKISKLNSGKGKWFDTDHKDFIKIYNKCAGNAKKIIAEGIKLLGMKQTQIMDHLQFYQGYLQLQKQKKLASEQYKQIKFLQEEQKRQSDFKKQEIKKIQSKIHQQKQLEQRMRKKQQIERFKQKKADEKQKMLQKEQQEEQKMSKIRAPPLKQSKKKQIMKRNRVFIQNQQKKIIEMKLKQQSIEKPKRLPSSSKVIQPQNTAKKM